MGIPCGEYSFYLEVASPTAYQIDKTDPGYLDTSLLQGAARTVGSEIQQVGYYSLPYLYSSKKQKP